jgi:dTDP-4-dehydrorhamnose reductase
MRIAVIGANGMLGTDVCDRLFENGHQGLQWNHYDLDIRQSNKLFHLLQKYKPDAVINCAAYHNVAMCEKNPTEAFDVNFTGVKRLAEACHLFGTRLIHISTNMVFDGDLPHAYASWAQPNPLNVYGYSKYVGECAAGLTNLNTAILRLGPIYGKAPCRAKGGKNFVDTILDKAKKREAISVVADQWVNPLSTVDAAKQVLTLAEDSLLRGIFHGGSNGTCSWFEFACEIFRQPKVVESAGGIVRVMAELGPSKDGIRRPRMGALEPSLPAPSWQQSLSDYFKG